MEGEGPGLSTPNYTEDLFGTRGLYGSKRNWLEWEGRDTPDNRSPVGVQITHVSPSFRM